MFPHALRFPLRQHSDFFTVAQRDRTAHLLVYIRKESFPTARFAVIVKKTLGTAVERAKFKRMIRSAVVTLSQQQPQLFALPYSFVFLPLGKVQSVEIYANEIKKSLERTAALAR